MLLTAPWQVRQPKCAICITVIYYAYCCCFFSLSGGGLRLLMPRFNGSYTFKCEKSCPNTWISIRARWAHPWETNQDLSFFNSPLSLYSLGLGTLHLLSSHFLSINLSQWDITIEFLCQVALLWWLKKNAAAITTKDTGPKMRGGKKKKKHLLQCPHSATFCGFKCHSNDDVFGALRWPPACMAADAPQL